MVGRDKDMARPGVLRGQQSFAKLAFTLCLGLGLGLALGYVFMGTLHAVSYFGVSFGLFWGARR